ncbi:MAG: hypothetical protein U9N41_02670 [Euryarchaeota archaeon]|nr:hypothetical protein [Euryarchaeota archaeon]
MKIDSCKELESMPKAEKEDLKMEYEKTQEMIIHLDTLNWTIGSILIAGVFVMIGFLGDKPNSYPWMAVISFIILGLWALNFKRHKDIQYKKFERLHQIEVELHLKQHLIVDCADGKKEIFRLKGYHCAYMLAVLVPLCLLGRYIIWAIFHI